MFTIRKIEDKKPRKIFPWKKLAIGILEFGRPIFNLYGDWKKRRQEEKIKEKRVHMLKRTLLILISVFVVLLIIGTMLQVFFSVRILSFQQIASVTGTPPPIDENGYTNLILMGQGDGDHDGKDLTDTIIVASIDPNETKSVVMLSFPRDLYFLHTEKMGAGKLNTFYRDYKGYLKYMKGMDPDVASKEALKELGEELGRNLGLQIHGVIKVDFIAFTQSVDAIGGVDLDVPYDIIDNEYPDENFGYDPFEIYKGMNHLDGTTALKYARSRSTTSDFGRSARQQQLIKEMAKKAKEEEIYKKPGMILEFLNIYKDNVETTLTTRELVGLLTFATEIEANNVVTMQLNDRNALYDSFIEPGGFLYAPPRHLFDGAAVLLPVSIPEFPVTWKQISALKKLLFDERAMYLKKPVIAVLNSGAPAGHARKLATELTRYGFPVDMMDNASIPKQETSFVSVKSSAEEEVSDDLAKFFASITGIEAKKMHSGLRDDETRELTIVIGKDYKYEPLQSSILSE
ncbi:LCP family protein [Patescibacteria group bacterium]|nr:LCP family protein [Patescibacteria group bacterium]MBU1123181.1 LCP family protein [Patescibacteria group bacterium]MBU1911729.1 LCP family protein [Patescibacteria group bacterium]